MAKTTRHELLVILRDLLTQLAEAERPKPPPPKPRVIRRWAPDAPDFGPPPRHLGTLPVDWLFRRGR